MIASPAMAVAYFLWRRTRSMLAAVAANVALLALVGHLLPNAAGQMIVIALFLSMLIWGVQLLGAFTFGPTDFGSRASGFPPHMLVMPAPTAALVGWPMLFGALTIGFVWTVFALMAKPDIPLLPLGGYFIAVLAWFQVGAWFPFPIPIVRGIAAIGSVVGLGIGGGVLGALEYPHWMIAASYVVSAAVAYLIALFGMTLARRGDGLEWRLAPSLAWLRPKSLAAARPFSSAAAAQLWYELRRNTLQLPLAMLLICALMFWFSRGPDESNFKIGAYDISSRMMVLGFVLLAPPMLALVISAGLGKFDFWSNKAPTFTPFFAARPFATSQYVAVKLKAAAIATLLTWLIVLAGIALAMANWWLGSKGEPILYELREDVSPWTLLGWGGLVLSYSIVLTWRNLASGMYVTLCGRPWVTNTISMLPVALFLAIGPVGHWLYNKPAHREILVMLLPWLVITLLVCKVAVSAAVAVRLQDQQLVKPRTVTQLFIAWNVVAAAAIVVAYVFYRPEPLIVPLVLLLLPATRIALAPLALHWNRHR